jgi:23S rRNA-/tRNA-specific pseudouridylate synthase
MSTGADCGVRTVCCSMQVAAGSTIQVLARAASLPALDPNKAPVKLRVVYEDDDVGIVVKPQGLPTQKSIGYSSSAGQCIKYAFTLHPHPGAHPPLPLNLCPFQGSD